MRFMIPPLIKLYAAALLVLNLIACASKPAPMHHHMMMSERASAFTQTMRRLWAEEVILRRRFVESGSQDVRARLLAKQDEIANAVAPYYGADTAKKFADLLEQRAVMTANDPHAPENSAAIAALLHQPSLAAMLDALLPMQELTAAFNQGMMIADEIANNIINKFTQQF
jgi:hypothetical protein